MKFSFKYEPSPDRSVYTAIMNSPEMQQDMLRRAENIKKEAYSLAVGRNASGMSDGSFFCDVQPGLHRCHARCSAFLESYGTRNGFATRNHNRKITESLQAAIDAAGR